MMTITIGSRELKNRLGSYLRQVRSGATIVVTDRGTPIAELRPLPPVTTEAHERLGALVASGLLAPRVSSRLVEREPASVTGGDLASAIHEEREERF